MTDVKLKTEMNRKIKDDAKIFIWNKSRSTIDEFDHMTATQCHMMSRGKL